MHKPCQPGIGAGDPCTAAWPKPAPGLGSGLPGRRTAAWPQVREPGTRDQGQLRLVNLGLGLGQLGQLREHLVNLGEHLVNLGQLREHLGEHLVNLARDSCAWSTWPVCM